jgi:hypothetical protein
MSQHELVVCSKCRSIKPVNAFVVDRSKKSGHTSQCKTCRYPQSREWKTQNCERQNLAQRRYRKRVSLNHRGKKPFLQPDGSWWEDYDRNRAERELRELGDNLVLIPEEETRVSLSKERVDYSLQEIDDIIVNAIGNRELSEADRLELSMALIILKMNGKGIWINFFILTS